MPDDVTKKDGLEELLPPVPQREGIGGNQPPSDVEILKQALEEGAAALIQRRDQLLASVERAPLVVEDEETCGKMADLIKLLASCGKAAEAARVAKKEPFLQCSRVVDGFYKAITDPLEKARKLIEPRLTKYQREKAERERQAREAAAKAAAEEAARAAEEAAKAAAKIESEAQLEGAISAETLAQQAAADAAAAEKAANAKAAELSRSRGDLGAVASLRTFWDFKDLDPAKLDLEALRPHLPRAALEQAVRSYIRAGFQPGHPGKQIAGVVIFENTSTRVA